MSSQSVQPAPRHQTLRGKLELALLVAAPVIIFVFEAAPRIRSG